ncbi:hypothetical protein [Actinomadura sp. 6N118]|uniref:hypothetical protein n=1 Tax=Actinomadura sp. 6N118 TaxID=3375151 RepID=UPI003791C695
MNVVGLESWHAVVGLGTDGGQGLADGDVLARGVHLLWALRPDLSFPGQGYHVSRRAHREPEWVCSDPANGLLPPRDGLTSWKWLDYEFEVDPGAVLVDLNACPPNGALRLPGLRSLTVRAPRRKAAVRAVGVGPPPLMEVLDGAGAAARMIARRRAARRGNGGWEAAVWAEDAVVCRLIGDDMRICGVCFGDADEVGGWQPLHERPILVPVVTPGTENDPANLHGTGATRAEANRRLSATLPDRADLAGAFANGLGPLVEALLRDGRGAVLPADATDTAVAATPPRLGMRTAQLLALMAVDPDVSRMLGLYWHDPVNQGSWDYKVVAHHGDVRYPGRTVTFDGLAEGDVGSPTLALKGVTFTGTAGLETVATNSGRALRVTAPRIGTAAGLRLDPPMPAVTLRLDGNPAVQFAAWRGAQRVATAFALFGAATLEDADGIDAVTWSTGPLDLVEVELYERAGVVGDLAAYAWRLSPAVPETVQELVLTEAGAAAEPTRLDPDGATDGATGLVGLDWGESSPVRDAGRPVRVHVGRARAADGHGTPPVMEIRNAERPAPAFTDSPAAARRRPGPDVPHRWIERGLPPSSYAWSVRGIDAFGRLSEWSERRVVAVPIGTVPPPPDAVGAAYLDPADPYLPDEQRTFVDRDGPGLLVWWTWPADRRISAPGVEPNGEFRVYVYARRGDPNVLDGTVLAVVDLGDRSRLETGLMMPGGADGLAGERLRVGGTSFAVVANTAGANASIEVAHLTAPTARPATGPFTVHLSETSGLRTDLAVPRTFGADVHTEPVGSLPRVTARILSVVETGGSATVMLDHALPASPGTPGRLVSGGIAFRVLSQSPASASLEVKGVVQPDGVTAWPVANELCTVWPGARYQVWLPGIDAGPAAAERLALTLVAVSTCDVDAVILHDPVPPNLPARTRSPGHEAQESRTGHEARDSRTGHEARDSRTGLEGPLSRVARVSVPHRGTPSAVRVELPPEQGGDIPADLAEPADWYGRAAYGLEFAPVSGAVGYRVLRASVAALFENDRGARQAGVEPYTGGPFDDLGASEEWLAEHHPAISVADLTSDLETHPDALAVLAAWRGWSAWYYPRKLNRAVMALAELPCNEEAFRPAHAGTIAASPFADTLDGRGLGRFAYRVRSVDASGNSGAWSAAFPLVEVRDVTPPAMPVLVSLLAGENKVTARWLRGPEPDLAEYRIWRAGSPEPLADVRRAEPLTVVRADTADVAGLLSYSDEDLPGLRTYFYRVAAVDTWGNVSRPTPAAAARVVDTLPPNPPAWVAAAWVTDRGRQAVRLSWRADEKALTCELQRRPLGGGVWRSVSPEIGATASAYDFTFVDRTAEVGVAYDYRVLAKDAAGNATVDFTIQPVRP